MYGEYRIHKRNLTQEKARQIQQEMQSRGLKAIIRKHKRAWNVLVKLRP